MRTCPSCSLDVSDDHIASGDTICALCKYLLTSPSTQRPSPGAAKPSDLDPGEMRFYRGSVGFGALS